MKFSDYAGKTIEDVFGKENLSDAIIYKAETFSSKMFMNTNGSFRAVDLPEQAQISTVNAFLHEDITNNGKKELIVGGNFSAIQPELGQYDASYGMTFQWDGQQLELIPNTSSGLKIKGDVRFIASLSMADNSKMIVFARNNQSLKAYKVQDE